MPPDFRRLLVAACTLAALALPVSGSCAADRTVANNSAPNGSAPNRTAPPPGGTAEYPTPTPDRTMPNRTAPSPDGATDSTAPSPEGSGAEVAAPAGPTAYPDSDHHTAEGFHNPDGAAVIVEHNRTAFLRWQWERLMSGLPREVPGGWHPPIVHTDLAPFRARGPQPRIAWLGHDTFLLAIGGALVLTDPQFSGRASPVSWAGPRRQVPLPVALAELPRVDVVLISHNHYDHLDRASVLGLNAQPGGPPLFLVPLGLRAWMRGQGIGNVRELDWWEHVQAAGLTLHLVPAQHFSARTPFDTNATLWGGWIVDHPSFRFYFAGDTGYGPLFREIGRRFAPIDLAAIPIGGYEPRWFMSPVHADPQEAVQIHRDVGARRSVGMHWGTFQLTDEALDEPPRALERALAAARIPPGIFDTFGFGEARLLETRQTAAR
jgi:L-ascorbate metabolism protein UlaG (beta-lactamase superfamily)